MKIKEAIEQAQGNDELWQQLDAALAEVSPPVRPEGSFTRKEFQARRNISDGHARKLLSRLVDKGKLTKHGNGSQTYYVLVK
jgi:predicted HTH transcriptional regulator